MTEGQNENGGLRAGMEMKKDYLVSRDQTARVVGSGGLDVLATPVLSAWIENVAYEMVDLWLKDDQKEPSVRSFFQLSSPTKIRSEEIPFHL